MGSFGPPHSIALLLAVAIVAALCGFTASVAVRRNKRRTRNVFLLGALCGFVAGVTLRRRIGAGNALKAALRGSKGHWLTQATLALSAAFFRIRSHGQVISAHTMRTIVTSASRYTGHGPKTSNKDAVGGFLLR